MYWGDPHAINFNFEQFDHMGVGAYSLWQSAAAGLDIQTFQCPVSAKATVNVALAVRLGSHLVTIVGDALNVTHNDEAVLMSEGSAVAESFGPYATGAGSLLIYREAESKSHRRWSAWRWRLQLPMASMTVNALTTGRRLGRMGHIMHYTIIADTELATSASSRGVCTNFCPVERHSDDGGAVSCEASDCDELPVEAVVFRQPLLAEMYDLCGGGSSSVGQPSACDPPTAEQACNETGFALGDAEALCASLQPDADLYHACVFDCCATADAEVCVNMTAPVIEVKEAFTPPPMPPRLPPSPSPPPSACPSPPPSMLSSPLPPSLSPPPSTSPTSPPSASPSPPPSMPLSPPAVAPIECDVVQLDFYAACSGSNADGSPKPLYNNLDGTGPRTTDPEVIRYQAIGTLDGAAIDLVVRAAGSYHPKNSANNGCNGQFGQINVVVRPSCPSR